MPLNRDTGNIDSGVGDAVVHDPYTALAGGCILPNQVFGYRRRCREQASALSMPKIPVPMGGIANALCDPL
jgi:hypothetical protein